MKSFCLVMAAFIAVQSAFSWLLIFFLWNQNLYKQAEKVRSNIPAEKLVTIVKNKNAEHIKVHGSEVEVNGKWFDIVSVTTNSEAQIFYCISDVQEEKILKDIENKSENRNDQKSLLLKSFSSEYASYGIQPKHFFSSNVIELIFYPSGKTRSGFASVLFSPPDFIA